MTWLLCDYGEVLCLPPRPEERAVLAGIIGPGADERYWADRPAYDRGDVSVEAYWEAVLGRPAGADLGQLVSTDVASWCHPNPASLAGAGRAARRGLRLALLSNAPREVAAAIDAQPWLSAFGPRLFSCHLRAVKPEPAAYQGSLAALGARPEEVVFVDDREANVAAAAALGIRAVQYRDPFDWDVFNP